MTKAYKIKLSMNKIMKIYVKNDLLSRMCVKSTLFYASDFLKYPIILRRFTKYDNMPNVVALRDIIADKVVKENEYCF